jgi:hypothetical protein
VQLTPAPLIHAAPHSIGGPRRKDTIYTPRDRPRGNRQRDQYQACRLHVASGLSCATMRRRKTAIMADLVR